MSGDKEVKLKYRLTVTEAEAFEKNQALRRQFDPRLFDQVQVNDSFQALIRAHAVISGVGMSMTKLGLPINEIEPGHSLGHIIRDYCHAMMLVKKIDEIDPKHLFIGAVAGALHDVGCALVERYSETETTLRHAEASSLLLDLIFSEYVFGLNDAEKILIQYAVAAHTNYLKPITILGKDGVSRLIEPYQDMDGDKPIFGIHLPRWVDRLDTSGPCFVGRHYYTLIKSHKNFGEEIGHYDVEFEQHMNPLLRDKPEGSRTMVEHLRMFASSQSNASVYGKYDLGYMVILRDQYRQWLEQIIQSTQVPRALDVLSQEKILTAWTRFLSAVIEPTPKGALYAQKLEMMFRDLPETTRLAWLPAFDLTMMLYFQWAENMSLFLNELPPGVSFEVLDFYGTTSEIGPWPFWEDK